MSLRTLSALTFLGFATLAPLATGQDATTKEPAAKSNEAVVKLVEPGENPRKTIRFAPKKGDKQTALMTMDMSQTMIMRGQKLPAVPTPAMQFTIDVEVTNVDSNGDITFNYSYPDASVVDEGEQASPAKAAVDAMLKSIVGLKGSGVVSARGFTKSSEIELPEGAAPQLKAVIDSMKDSLSKMSSPVPEEPIGVGGKWTVTQTVAANGIVIDQVSTHTVKAFKGDKVDLTVEIKQSAGKQEMKAPGLPAGSKMTLNSLESTGSGTMLLTPSELFPVSTMKSDTKSSMDLDMAGQQQPMELQMTIDMTIKPPK